MLPDLEHFHLLRPWWLLIIVAWMVLAAVMRTRKDQGDMFSGIIAPHLLSHLRLEKNDSRWINPSSFGLVFALTTAIVLAGPSWRQQPSPLSEDESALVLLLDASSSMNQRDIQPSRVARARHKASDLLALRPDKRSAVIAYAGSAHTVLTLTADQDVLNQYLEAIKPEMMPRRGKFPEYALPLVDDILRDTNSPATVVLLSDGLGADSQAAFSEYFATRPHQLIVLGIGSSLDSDGAVPLDKRALDNLADDAGGHYFDLTIDDSDVRAIERRIESHYVVIDDDALPWLDSGYPLVFVALALFLMWFRKGWTLSWSWLLLPLILAGQPQPANAETAPPEEEATVEAQGFALGQWFADLWLTPDQQGRLLLQFGDYRASARHFDNPMWKGIASYYNEDFMQAAEYFSRSDSDDALFNEANARSHARDFLRAVKRYDRLLARNPDYPGAQANRDKVQSIIDDINRMSESQQGEEGSSEEREMGGDDAVPAEGAEKLSFEQVELKQYSAEEILGSEATRDMWLKGVQKDPSNFLAAKFNMQLQQREQPK
ncbi:VWA domain-containing protein [Halioglobus maricola]|uniref:VWA domain-containing protein n=1 Tax=Halioglobus maricola TaxID=2601894 RepID=A0A5P9NEV4_9GAMM|nr:VWA domain-containing protein [Halioglobus maricola]QFU74273.1 VWA domain-containing protein [Halioglobus maricola]